MGSMKKKKHKDKIQYKNKIRRQQLDKAKPQSQKEEDDCGISDESLARMKHKVGEWFGIEHEVIRDSSLERMSEILREYADPFLNIVDTDSKAEYEKAIMISIMFWNYSIVKEASSKEQKKIEKMLRPMMSDVESKYIIEYMLDRKRQMYPDNKRMIMSYEVTETSDSYNLYVVSTML